MKRAIILATMSVLCILQVGWGQIPRTISYQGVLKDAGGNLVNDSKAITFRLYDAVDAATGSAIWSEQLTVQIDDGIFSVILGSSIPLNLDFDVPYWLEIEVNGAPLSPRTPLMSAPYSFHALRADTAQYALSASTGGGAGWSLSGNAGTTAGTHFIGTTDGVALDFRVNNARALRLEPGICPNVIGGHIENIAAPGVMGATISGGGAATAGNEVAGDYGTVGGGERNSASGGWGTVGGGKYSKARGLYSVVSGGGGGTAADSNAALGDYSAIGGGQGNTASGDRSIVGGGWDNIADKSYATIGGGVSNAASGDYATVGGGENNSVSYNYATIGGGSNNTARGINAFVGGGDGNTASGEHATIAGGWSNATSANYTTVSGGYENIASGGFSTVGGGFLNAVGGVGTVGGGESNTASGEHATVGGGRDNTASGEKSTVGGGHFNIASGQRATVPGGQNNVAGGGYSFAAGWRAKANHGGTFVWADSSTNADFTSTAADQFLIRATGGVGIGTANPLQKLHVKANSGDSEIRIEGSSVGVASTASVSFYNSTPTRIGYIGDASSGTDDIYIVADANNSIRFYTNPGSIQERLTIQSSGNVGIGTANPQYELDVIGDVRATGSVYYGGTEGSPDGTIYTKPDYVFEGGYEVMTTEEVEKYLKKEGHLPWMTSVKQEREENDKAVNMTRMAFETVETAENLQLQIIELTKLGKDQQREIEALQAAVGALPLRSGQAPSTSSGQALEARVKVAVGE